MSRKTDYHDVYESMKAGKMDFVLVGVHCSAVVKMLVDASTLIEKD